MNYLFIYLTYLFIEFFGIHQINVVKQLVRRHPIFKKKNILRQNKTNINKMNVMLV